MKNIIIIGDSFCASLGWPDQLAQKLNLRLIQHGFSGHGWWIVRNTLKKMSVADKENCELIVFVHTSAARLFSESDALTTTNWSDPVTEIDHAAYLYFKYIYDHKFHSWAQSVWFNEINEEWKNCKVIHLFGFMPEKDNLKILTNGLCVLPTLSSISLNEIGSEKISSLTADMRLNHFSEYNNKELADQLFNFAINYKQDKLSLDTSRFKLETNYCLDKNF